jgi:type IV pilus modification protein PilV
MIHYKMQSRTEHGFSLIELLVAIVVLAVGLVAIAKFQGRLMAGSDFAKARTEATIIAQDQIETLRAYEGVSGSAGLDYDEILNGSSTVAGTNATYSLTWTVSTNTSPDYKTLSMVATWSDRENQTQTVTLMSNINDIAPQTSGRLIAGASTGLTFPLDGEAGGDEETPPDEGDSDEETPPDEGDGDEETPPDEENGGEPLPEEVTYYFIDISGAFSKYGHPDPNVTGVSASGTHAASCTYTQSAYICSIGPVPSTDTWSGSVSISSNKTVCSPPANPTNYSAISANAVQNYAVAKKSSDCP